MKTVHRILFLNSHKCRWYSESPPNIWPSFSHFL